MASTTEYVQYLDRLRMSGRTNMSGASPFLADEFGLEVHLSRKILAAWMKLDFGIPAPIRAAHINKAVPDLIKVGE